MSQRELIFIDSEDYRGLGFLIRMDAYTSLVSYQAGGIEYETYAMNDEFYFLEETDIEQE